MTKLILALTSATAMVQQAAAQGCATVDTMPDDSAVGNPADCASLLAAGFTCEDLACYAPALPVDSDNPQCGVHNLEGYTGQCSLTCGQNTYDGVFGEGACQALIAAGDLTCELNFAAGGELEGYCDFACGFCSIDPPPPALPPPTPPSLNGNAGTSPWQCQTTDLLDQTYAAGACSTHLGAGELSCEEHFSGLGQHAAQCTLTCQLNILEHPLAFMTADAQLGLAAIQTLQDFYWPIVGATSAQMPTPCSQDCVKR